jgi:hypothetical protein
LWDNDGTAQPAAPEKNKLGYFTFNTSTYLDNDEQLNLQHQKKQTVGILLLSTTYLLGIMRKWNHTACSTRKVNCWDTCFQHYLMYLGIMMEPPPAAPENQTVGITFQHHFLLLIMMEPHNLQHQKKQTVGDALLSTPLLVLGIMMVTA